MRVSFSFFSLLELGLRDRICAGGPKASAQDTRAAAINFEIANQVCFDYFQVGAHVVNGSGQVLNYGVGARFLRRRLVNRNLQRNVSRYRYLCARRVHFFVVDKYSMSQTLLVGAQAEVDIHQIVQYPMICFRATIASTVFRDVGVVVRRDARAHVWGSQRIRAFVIRDVRRANGRLQA